MSRGSDPEFVGLDAERWPAPPLGKRLRVLLRENRKLTMSTFTGIFADLYENRPLFFLDQPIEYPFFRGSEISFRTLSRFVNRVGNLLRSLGVERGDRVGLATRNRVELAFAEFGAQKIGAVPVPLNYMLRAEEIQHLMSDSGARVLITDRAVFEENIKDRSRIPSVETWILVSRQTPPGFVNFAEEIARTSEELEPIELADSDLAVIFYTAGTTGLPKGAMLSSGGLMFGIRRYSKIRAILPFSKRDLALLVMPLAHTSGHQALLLLMAMASPAYLMGKFDPALTLELIQKLRATSFSGIPTMYRMLLEAGADRYDLSSIKFWGGGADNFSNDLVQTFLDLAKRGKRRGRARFFRGYGLAETAGQLMMAQPGPLGDGCIGKPVLGVKVQLWDENLKPVPEGQVGEIVVRSPGVMKGYWNNSAMTEAAFRGGWFHTGDLARYGKNSRYYMASRKKEMIKVGGYSVFPAEVETELMAHPDILRAAVVGIPHELKGERPAAAVLIRPGATTSADEILAWAKERIAPYKCPRQVFLVDEIPMSSAMKIKRADVREMLLQKIGRPAAAAGGKST